MNKQLEIISFMLISFIIFIIGIKTFSVSIDLKNFKNEQNILNRNHIAEICDSVFNSRIETILLEHSLNELYNQVNKNTWEINDMGKLWCTIYDFMSPEKGRYDHLEGMDVADITQKDLNKGDVTNEMIMELAELKQSVVDSIYKNMLWSLEMGSSK